MIDPLLSRFGRARLLGVVIASVVVAGVMAVNEYAFQSADRSVNSVRDRNDIRRDATQLRALLVDAESAVRGYLLTGREDYLQPNFVAREDIERLLTRLRAEYANTPWQSMVDEVDRQSDEMLALIDEKIRMYKNQQHEGWRALLMSNLAKERMDAVRLAISRIETHESEMVASERPSIYFALNIGRYGVHALMLLSLLWWLYFLRKNEEAQQLMAQRNDNVRAERDRLEIQVRQRTRELTELARYLTRAREQERQHLARELHDELGALLTAAKLDVARIHRMASKSGQTEIDERLRHMGMLIDDGIALKRRIIEDLRPSSLSNLGLVPSLEILTREFGERAGLTLHHELCAVECDDAGQLAIYRLIQEALTNVHRHAKARTVWIVMRDLGDDGMELTIRDDGAGFQASEQTFGHHGLLGMRYRMESLGGELRVSSAPGQGTEVQARLPFRLRCDPAPSASEATGS
ncbi:MAG: CHASE3 domain-containing protein [Piscinibacter sp.]